MHDGSDGPTGDQGGLPWERPVRQVTLAARADVLEQMADPWTKYLHAIDDAATQLQKIWEDVLEKEWKGDAANACYRHWETLVQQIGDYKKHYAPMPGLLKGSASAVTEATHAIPVPVFANNKLPGGFDGNPPDGNAMYDDYQSNRGEYADYAFRKQALDEADQQMSPSGVRVRSGKTYTTGESPGAADRAAITDSQRQLRKNAVNTWYGQHQGEANRVRDKLVAEYSSTIGKLPDGAGFQLSTGGDGSGKDGKKEKETGDGYQPGGGGATYGAGSFGAVGGAGIGASAVHAAMPTARHAAIPSPPSSITDGMRLAGDNPAGVGPTGGSSLSGEGSGSRLPLSWSTAGGGGGAGSFGAVGPGGGFGGAGVPSASVPENGWWNTRPPSGPVGPAAASPTAERLAAGRGGGTAAAGSRVGMMPGAGAGAGNRQRDERSTWLTEDDDDVFGPKHTAPKTNNAGAIE